MPFGIKSAPEEFQRQLDKCLEGLENISVNHDGIVILGSSETTEEATASHDVAFKVLLERCRVRPKAEQKEIMLQAQQSSIHGPHTRVRKSSS